MSLRDLRTGDVAVTSFDGGLAGARDDDLFSAFDCGDEFREVGLRVMDFNFHGFLRSVEKDSTRNVFARCANVPTHVAIRLRHVWGTPADGRPSSSGSNFLKRMRLRWQR